MVPKAASITKPNAWFRSLVPTEQIQTQASDLDPTPISSVSSPSGHDSEHFEVDQLLEGIDYIRENDLFTTPPAASPDITQRSEKKHAALPPHALPSEHRTNIVHLSVSQTTSLRTVSEKHPSTLADPAKDFPQLFKVYPCPHAADCYASGMHPECFYYHDVSTDRRRSSVAFYRPYMCRFIGESDGCRKGDHCPFAHNDFERRYHPDRFGKETCRDFLRNDCPRRYCTFRHEVSGKVEIALTAMDAMNDKELLQLVLKITDTRGRALSEKLARRFGYGKRYLGWRLEGFGASDDSQRMNMLFAHVDDIRHVLHLRGEHKWAGILKTNSLRDMMSGVRKVTEDIRERISKSERNGEKGHECQRLIRTVFSNANWSCHSHEGDNPFIVTPENQNDAVSALQRLVQKVPYNRCDTPSWIPTNDFKMRSNAPSFLTIAAGNGTPLVMDPVYKCGNDTKIAQSLGNMWQ